MPQSLWKYQNKEIDGRICLSRVELLNRKLQPNYLESNYPGSNWNYTGSKMIVLNLETKIGCTTRSPFFRGALGLLSSKPADGPTSHVAFSLFLR